MGMSRTERRALKRRIPELAKDFLDFGPNARERCIASPTARGVLERMLDRLIAANFEPQVMQIPRETGMQFPQFDPALKGNCYLAMGVDVSGAFTYCLKCLEFPTCDDATEEKALAQTSMLFFLSMNCGYAGRQTARAI